MPSNFRSNSQSPPLKRSCVSVAAIGSSQSGMCGGWCHRGATSSLTRDRAMLLWTTPSTDLLASARPASLASCALWCPARSSAIQNLWVWSSAGPTAASPGLPGPGVVAGPHGDGRARAGGRRSPVIIPMTFSNVDYLNAIRLALSRSGQPVLHFCLTAPLDVIRERLTSRGEPMGSRGGRGCIGVRRNAGPRTRTPSSRRTCQRIRGHRLPSPPISPRASHHADRHERAPWRRQDHDRARQPRVIRRAACARRHAMTSCLA